MKNRLWTFAILLLGGSLAIAQVGINTPQPQATFDVVGAPDVTGKLDGIIAPRITGDKLRAKTYTAAQTGALVYVTAADTTPASQTVDVTAVGYYYFNGTKWIAISPVDWHTTGNTGTTPTTATLGTSISTGDFLGTSDSKNLVIATGKNVKGILDVNGTLRGGNANDGTVVSAPYASFAWGSNNTLTDSSSSNVVLGKDNNVASQGANFPGAAIGSGNKITNGAKALGNNNIINGANQFAVGNGNSAVSGSTTGIALGNDNIFSGFVLGTSNNVTRSNYAFGNANVITASGGGSMGIGFGASVSVDAQTVYANSTHAFLGKSNAATTVVGVNMLPTASSGSGAAIQMKGFASAANATCTSSDEGSIRYNSTTRVHEGCNGSNWKALY
ncbi:hypothetical protein [Chryseobacterium oryctis]|uniref:Head domain of trimeric autotransporter adhesin n=1 Tax=Chryseobacterium oryctis TaxID=2952618 RepID=A0ABT3HK89_9FLAO|nr:hypothetical protein [Chryseobacterium oryctis]MCW3160209.1 hypothetical protein [Chryseobacterium oryctis]